MSSANLASSTFFLYRRRRNTARHLLGCHGDRLTPDPVSLGAFAPSVSFRGMIWIAASFSAMMSIALPYCLANDGSVIEHLHVKYILPLHVDPLRTKDFGNEPSPRANFPHLSKKQIALIRMQAGVALSHVGAPYFRPVLKGQENRISLPRQYHVKKAIPSGWLERQDVTAISQLAQYPFVYSGD